MTLLWPEINLVARVNLKEKCHEIIFEAETPSGKLFDVVLLWIIVLSVGVVLFDSVESYNQQLGPELRLLEWVFTILFTVEYCVRIYCAKSPWRYVFSFYGIVDFLSIIPTYLSVFFAGTQHLLVIRGLRLLRVFRVLKLGNYSGQAKYLLAAMNASRAKITVFLGAVLCIVIIMGAVMYLVEGEDAGFTSIPTAIYWAIVTMTTVGYGDLVPQSALGQFLASIIMIMGYGIIAVPTGIVSVELANASKEIDMNKRKCPRCHQTGHNLEAIYCFKCGTKI